MLWDYCRNVTMNVQWRTQFFFVSGNTVAKNGEKFELSDAWSHGTENICIVPLQEWSFFYYFRIITIILHALPFCLRLPSSIQNQFCTFKFKEWADMAYKVCVNWVFSLSSSLFWRICDIWTSFRFAKCVWQWMSSIMAIDYTLNVLCSWLLFFLFLFLLVECTHRSLIRENITKIYP